MECVHGAEGYEPSVRRRVVDEASFDALEVEVVGVHEMHRTYHEHAHV